MGPTRIAIATTDGISVCDHLARSASFFVVEIEAGRVVGWETRARGTDSCGNHRGFIELLAGCQAVVCGGIGQGAFNALAAHGIETIVLAEPGSVKDAIAGYVAGALVTTEERVCLCC